MKATTAGGISAKGPKVLGELPGPRSVELLARQGWRESNARRSFLRDVDGNVFIDFLTGAGVLSLGHCRPEFADGADVGA